LFYPILGLIAVASLCLSSCSKGDDSQCVQYVIIPKLVDSNGKALPDTIAESLCAYLFLNGKFDHIVTTESNGHFLLSFDGSKKASLVIVGSSINGTNVAQPSFGEDIDSVMVNTSSPENLYYGQFDYISQVHDSIKSVEVKLVNMRATIRVAVRGLHKYYGNGNFSVKLSGLHNALTYDGRITGDSVAYTPNVSFINDEQLLTDSVNTLPTAQNEAVNIGIYKNGTIIWQSSEDSSGNTIKLNPGDNNVVTIDCGYRIFGFTVLSWNKFLQNVDMR